VPIGAIDGTVAAGLPGTPLAVLERPEVASRPAGAADAAEPGRAPYVVQPGDTLWSLSRRFGTTVDDLLRANGIESPQELRAGQPLELPGKMGSGETPRDPPADPPVQKSGSLHEEEPPAVRPSRRYPLAWPVQGAITSRFGKRKSRQHDGIDIGASEGTSVRAAADGEVLFAAKQGGYGNLVLLRHRGGLVTVYAHHERNLVHKGQRVRAGQVIARVGQTGRASGPHLHFEVRRSVKPQNPLKFLPP
jgi:lipoprotein NlpD